MISKLLSFIPPQVFVVATGVFLIIMGIISLGYQLSLNHVRNELVVANATIVTERTNLAVCRANVAELKAAIVGQNSAIDKLQSDAATANAKADARVAAALNRKRKPVAGAGPEIMNAWASDLLLH